MVRFFRVHLHSDEIELQLSNGITENKLLETENAKWYTVVKLNVESRVVVRRSPATCTAQPPSVTDVLTLHESLAMKHSYAVLIPIRHTETMKE